MNRTIVEAVLEHAVKNPDKLAVCFKKQQLTYGQLGRRVCSFARLLQQEEQIKSGDIIMISALSKPEYVVALLAVQYLGATVVPVDKAALEETLIRLYHFVNPKFILSDSRIHDNTIRKLSLKEWYQTAKISEEEIFLEKTVYDLPDMNSIAEIIFTTGTTGEPKGAMLSYENILAITHYTRDGVHRKFQDIELIPLPLNHSFGLRVLRTILYMGATAVLQNGFMFPRELETNLQEFRCTGMSIVPASVERLYRSMGSRFGEVLGMLEYMEVSAGSLSVGMKRNLLKTIPQVHLYNVWGSSETGGVIFLDVTSHPEHIGALGLPAEGVELQMLNMDGKIVDALSPETAGRMIMRGNMQMQGYYKQDDITEKTIVDGYLYTNDLAYQTDDGYVYMLGRADDIINVGGEKVSPVEVENIAGLSEDIQECACVAGADPEGILGQVPVLYVVPQGAEFDSKKLLEFLSIHLEQYKLPKQFVVMNSLPRNQLQKIDRKKLMQMWENRNNIPERNPVVNAIYGRRSVRDFQEKQVPKELLEQVVKCGYQAPSGHNMQTWRFTVVHKKEEIERLKTTIAPVAKRKNVYFYGFRNPDALILISNDKRNHDGVQDSSCAAQNIMLAAYSYGLGSVWLNALMNICDEPEIRMILDSYGIPENHNVWAMIAVGYPANQPNALAKKENVIRWIE